MSGRLVSTVLESQLPHRLKSLAAVLASFGRDDGTSIRPAITRVARLWSRSERRTQAAITDLIELGVLVVVGRRGPGRPVQYRIDLGRLAEVRSPSPRWTRQRSGQLVLSFPQGFAQPIARLAEDSGDFHSFHRSKPDDFRDKPDASVTRSVQILRVTSTRRKRSKANNGHG